MPTKKAGGAFTFNSVDPDQNKHFTAAPVSLHPSTLWLETARAHIQLKSPSSSHCSGGKEQGPSPALFKHIASSRFPPRVSRFHPNPSRKLTGEFTSWFLIQDEKTLIRVFPLLLYMGLSFSLTLKERHPASVPPEKRGKRCPYGIWDTCCDRKGQQQQYTHPEGGQTDRHI